MRRLLRPSRSPFKGSGGAKVTVSLGIRLRNCIQTFYQEAASANAIHECVLHTIGKCSSRSLGRIFPRVRHASRRMSVAACPLQWVTGKDHCDPVSTAFWMSRKKTGWSCQWLLHLLIEADEFALGQYVSLHCLKDCIAVGTWGNGHDLIQCEDLEMIVMRRVADRRSGSEVARRAPTRPPLQQTVPAPSDATVPADPPADWSSGLVCSRRPSGRRV